VLQTPHAERLIDMIYGALVGMGIMHLGSQSTTPATPATQIDKQSGFASLGMLIVLAALAALLLSGCGTLNAYTGAALNAAEAGYTGTRQNAKSADDMKFIVWSDSACAIPLGALSRNATGNPNAVSAALTACPVANMGIITAKDGQVQVQLTQPTPTAPYVKPIEAAKQ
jgi:uncharacterized protein YceK